MQFKVIVIPEPLLIKPKNFEQAIYDIINKMLWTYRIGPHRTLCQYSENNNLFTVLINADGEYTDRFNPNEKL